MTKTGFFSVSSEAQAVCSAGNLSLEKSWCHTRYFKDKPFYFRREQLCLCGTASPTHLPALPRAPQPCEHPCENHGKELLPYLDFPCFIFLQHESEHVGVGARQQPEVQGVLGERELLEEHCRGTQTPR